VKGKVFLMICGLVLSSAACAFTPVGPTTQTSTLQDYELPSGAPADVYVWRQDYMGSYGWPQRTTRYECDFSDLQQTCTHQSSATTITVMLKEQRSGMQHPINLQGYMKSLYYDVADPENSTASCGIEMNLNDGRYWICGNVTTNSRVLTVYIPQSEMNNLPIGGVWKGKLKLTAKPNGSGAFDYNADITLKGKAPGKQDIYFPEFNGANPLVQLDLHPTGSVTSDSYVEDTTSLDMCLYDGFNSNSDSMKLSFRDEGKTAAARKDGDFSLYNTGTGGTDEAQRIDYRLEMFDPHSKSWRSVKNNHAFTLQAGVNGQDQVRPVRLPSIIYPVLCAPAPLRLIVDKFRVTDKAAGYYKGILTVEFSPSLNSI
jgi:CblD like pilus biogenesis initiator